MSLRNMFSLILLLFAVGVDAPAHAAALYVKTNGSDAAACTPAAPCASLSGAVGKAGPLDTIFCLDAVSSFGFTINKSISIDCHETGAMIYDFGTPGLMGINIDIAASDTRKVVHLRGLTIVGSGAASVTSLLQTGVGIATANAVYLTDMVIRDIQVRGIFDFRTGGQTRLFVTDSILSNIGGPGIVAAASAVGITVLDNVRSENNGYGIAAATGNNVAIRNSVFSGNSNAGIEGDAGAQIVVDGSTITHNNIGVQSGSSVRLSNNNIEFNNTAISGASGTFGNNRFSGNGTIGTAPVALGGASSDLGQQ